MSLNVAKEIAALERLTVKELRAKYSQAFGEETTAHNKVWLVKRIIWRLQALAEGDLSERARQRAAQLANDADLRLAPPKRPATALAADRLQTTSQRLQGDGRLPMPGTVLTRAYKGALLQVKVLSHGFEFDSQVYQSLSAVAKVITGQHCSGFYFFRLGKAASR
jgi:hypothetical protein